jgi:uncharacterized protein YraI
MQLPEKTNNSLARLKIAIATVIVLCIVASVVVLVGVGLYRNRFSLAQPLEPGIDIPVITLLPVGGPADTSVTIYGQGWPRGSTVLIYTVAPDETSLPDFATAGAVADNQGHFTVTLDLSTRSSWEGVDLVKIIARTPDSDIVTQAFFRLTESIETSLTPTGPRDTPPEPTATVVIQQPPPESGLALALATATTDVNVRSGPGTNYPVLGVLRARQSAEITGLSPNYSWWQIEFADVTEGRAWVSTQFVATQQTTNIPIVPPPALSPAPPTTIPTSEPVVINDWRGEYYDNPNLGGSPVLIRNDAVVLFGWGPDSPGPGVPADNFSARWTRDLHFSAGAYRFEVLVDDGARLWIDDELVLDRWRTGPPESYTAEVTLAEGTHRVRLEYFEYIYDAQIHLTWEHVAEASVSEWQAEYFDNPNVEGAPVLVRNEAEIDHNWGAGSPGSGVPADNFSARWLRQVNLFDGVYEMRVTVDDGVRVWIDDVPIIDSWHDGDLRLVASESIVGAGLHWLRVEYYERGGSARLQADWHRTD